MNLEVEAFEGELKHLREFKSMVKHTVFAEQFANIYFISGEGGNKDRNGLPDRIHICPAYGCDWFQVYEKSDKSFGPEW